MHPQNEKAVSFRQNLIRYGGDAYPEIVEKAQGCYVWDAAGRKILDFTSGQMCATVGHNHPNIVAAIRKSCDSALHLFSGMIPRSVVQLADALAKIVPRPLKKSLLLNTGSESNDAALKMAKLHTGGYEVVGLGGSWHGVTGNAGAVSFASDRKGYGPGMPGSFVLPEPNAYRCPIKHCRDKCDRTCMQVGFEMFDMQSTGAPAAVITSDEIEESVHRRGFAFYTSHVSDPLPASVGVAVLETIEQENLLERAREMGEYLAARLRELQGRHEEIGDVRGMGLLRGIELVKDRESRAPHHELGALTTQRCLELGLSMNIRRRPERGSVWRIAPPLTVTREDIDLAMTIFDQALREAKHEMAARRQPAASLGD